MRGNPTYQSDYAAFMKKIYGHGYAVLLRDDSRSPRLELYIPHHGIYHKPHKIWHLIAARDAKKGKPKRSSAERSGPG